LLTKGKHWLRQQWRIVTSVLISLAILVLAVLNREWLIEAFGMVQNANLAWLAAALVMILISYGITSQVLMVGLRSMHYRMSVIRVWAMALVAVVISQSVPAGGVGSYAFLTGLLARRGIPPGKSALIASMETLSYVGGMLLVFVFSLFYLLINGLGTGLASYAAAGVALLLLGTVVFVFTRSRQQLTSWLLGIKNGIARLLHLEWGDRGVMHVVNELIHGRELIVEHRSKMIWLIPIQIGGLCGHSLAMLMVFWSLGAQTSFFVVLSAFGIALITSTFNVLPGGGGTVEAALAAVLTRLGMGMAAIPVAIIFRLLNFWLLLPVAAGCYYWLMHEPPIENLDKQGEDTQADDQHSDDQMMQQEYGKTPSAYAGNGSATPETSPTHQPSRNGVGSPERAPSPDDD
jgi:uncharacterized protein (TIRG00374 family)